MESIKHDLFRKIKHGQNSQVQYNCLLILHFVPRKIEAHIKDKHNIAMLLNLEVDEWISFSSVRLNTQEKNIFYKIKDE